MDPRDVLALLGRTSASGAIGDGARDDAPATRHDGDADGGLVHTLNLPARAAETVPMPDDLPRVLVSRLANGGITTLYRHQAEARDRARAGHHVVVSTGTASGKSLAYQLPVIESVLTDPTATALYLAPTKALARDQLRAWRGFRLPQVRAAVLDGDTPSPERDAIRRTANVVLTNPDLLHFSLLPDHRRWGDLLHRLCYVIVDEAHVARGVFGGHVSLVLRRLRRLAERYDATPTFLLASATVGNPAQHASALTGLDVEAIERDGSPRGELAIGLWRPPLTDEETGARRSLISEAADLLASFVASDVQTLVFTKSRKAAELIALSAKERLGTDPAAHTIRAYRAGYLAAERRALEDDLRSGRLKGVAATEALELGIDVAGLDAVILAGWPGTTASFWQRLGRAGRDATTAAVGVLVAGDDPLDHYLVDHPTELAERAPEAALLDPDNPYLLAPHLRCAAHEAAIDDAEATDWFGPTAPGLLAADADAGRLRLRGGRYWWTSRNRPSNDVGLRSMGTQSVRIVDADTGAVIGDVDGGRAHTSVHAGAIYLHQGRRFEVASLDLDRGVALVRRDHGGHSTRPRSDTDVRVVGSLRRADRRRDGHTIGVGLSQVDVTVQVSGYDVLAAGTREVIDRRELDLPPQDLHTVAVWWTIQDAMLASAGVAAADVPGSLHAAEHAAIGMLPLVAMCDRWDLGGLSTARHIDTGLPTVFIYDGHQGGAGLAERSFDHLQRHLQATRDAIAGCRCHTGCPSCVQSPKCGNGNDPLDKTGAMRVLDLVLRAQP